MKIARLMGLPIAALIVVAGAIALRVAMTADASPLMHLTAESAPTPSVKPVEPPPETIPVGAGVVAPPNALHRYVTDAMLDLPRAYVDRNEDAESRIARMTTHANDIAAAVEASDLPPELRHKYAITLVFIGQRETLWARRIRDLGNEDEGRAHYYYQIHEWKGMDLASSVTALDLLRNAPGAWCLPSPRPWEGLPKAAKYLREHPFSP